MTLLFPVLAKISFAKDLPKKKFLQAHVFNLQRQKILCQRHNKEIKMLGSNFDKLIVSLDKSNSTIIGHEKHRREFLQANTSVTVVERNK